MLEPELISNYTPSRFSGLKAVLSTIREVISALAENKLHALIPVAIFIIFSAIGLYFINLVSPIAPFVYSLF
jgi:hypothetical protein